MKYEEEFKEQIGSRNPNMTIKDLKGMPHFGDKEWKDGDIPLFAMFVENENDIQFKSFAPRHMDEIWLHYALFEQGKFPKFIPITSSCQICGKDEIYSGIDVIPENRHDNSRTGFFCQECCENHLEDEMWITYNIWDEMEPKVPHSMLPINFDHQHPLWLGDRVKHEDENE